MKKEKTAAQLLFMIKNLTTLFKHRKKNIGNTELVFHEDAIIDVTYCDAEGPEDPLGYVCKCKVNVYSNGIIQVLSKDNEILESIPISNIFMVSSINKYDPKHEIGVFMVTEDVNIRLVFHSTKQKNKYLNSLNTVFNTTAAPKKV